MAHYLIGAGGHAKVIYEILEACSLKVAGVFDNDPGKSLFQLPALEWDGYLRQEEDVFIISIGNNTIRKKVAERDVPDAIAATAVHPSANISPRSIIGVGTVVMAGVTINADARIGRHCIINTNASIDHDCVIEDFVHISPNATLTGNVQVGEGTQVGAGAVVIPGVKIGRWCVIGAGAVILKDVPDNATVVGNPGRIIKIS